MKPKIKKAWVEALRSGEYKQCRGVLHERGRYCCLGVLWEIDRRPWYDKNWGVATEDGGPFGALFTAAFGIPEGSPQTLANMNDEGSSFAEIADWIEANL